MKKFFLDHEKKSGLQRTIILSECEKSKKRQITKIFEKAILNNKKSSDRFFVNSKLVGQ